MGRPVLQAQEELTLDQTVILDRFAKRERALPEEPLVVIESSESHTPLDLAELWHFRELLYLLTWRDVKVRYKQTALGVAWVILQPLLITIIFTIFLGVLVHVPSGGVPYALLIYIGLLPWTFFASAVTIGGLSVVNNAHLITKVYFPRMLVPLSAIAARLLDLSIAFSILVVLMAYYRLMPTETIIMLPFFIVLLILFSSAIVLIASAMHVKYRDIGFVLPVLIQLWMYVSPVLYSSSIIPQRWARLYALNPMVGIVEGFRTSILGGQFDWFAIGISVAATVVLLIYATYAFKHLEENFADII
jgi:lipopolysaccharide transport system permease protein